VHNSRAFVHLCAAARYPSDIWSLGLLIYTLAEAKFPFIDDTFWSLRSRFKNRDIPRLPLRRAGGDGDGGGGDGDAARGSGGDGDGSSSSSSHGYSQECCDFVANMLQVDPRARSTAKELLTHAFIRKHIDDKKRDKLDSTVVKAALAPKMTRQDSTRSEKILRQLQEDSEHSSDGGGDDDEDDDDDELSFASGGGHDSDGGSGNDNLYADDADPPTPGPAARASSASSSSSNPRRRSSPGSRRNNSGSSAKRPSSTRSASRARHFEHLLSASRTWTAEEAESEVELTIRKLVKHQVRARMRPPSRVLIEAFARSTRVSTSKAIALFESEWKKLDANANASTPESAS
jgi:serine/threonine protein kinase